MQRAIGYAKELAMLITTALRDIGEKNVTDELRLN